MLDAPTVLRGHLADRAAPFCCLQAVCSELPMEEIQNLYRDLLPLYLGLPDQLEEASMIKDKYYLLGDAPDGLKKKKLIILVPIVGGVGRQEEANIFLLCGLLCCGHWIDYLLESLQQPW